MHSYPTGEVVSTRACDAFRMIAISELSDELASDYCLLRREFHCAVQLGKEL